MAVAPLCPVRSLVHPLVHLLDRHSSHPVDHLLSRHPCHLYHLAAAACPSQRPSPVQTKREAAAEESENRLSRRRATVGGAVRASGCVYSRGHLQQRTSAPVRCQVRMNATRLVGLVRPSSSGYGCGCGSSCSPSRLCLPCIPHGRPCGPCCRGSPSHHYGPSHACTSCRRAKTPGGRLQCRDRMLPCVVEVLVPSSRAGDVVGSQTRRRFLSRLCPRPLSSSPMLRRLYATIANLPSPMSGIAPRINGEPSPVLEPPRSQLTNVLPSSWDSPPACARRPGPTDRMDEEQPLRRVRCGSRVPHGYDPPVLSPSPT